MRNIGLEEAQTGIKIARRNINNFRYVDDTTLMAESEEQLKSLLMMVKEKQTWYWYRNINNLIYADDTILMAESEEELKSLLMKVKEESEKVGFKTQHSEN